MRITAFLLAAAFTLATGAATACPMQTTAQAQQTVASSNSNSTPIPPKAQQGNEG